MARRSRQPRQDEPDQPDEPPAGERLVRAAQQGVAALDSKHRRVLESIFEIPTRSAVRLSDIEKLIKVLGGTISPGRGSGRRIMLVRPAVFHMPHPDLVTDEGAVKDIREYLRAAGVIP